MLNNEIGEALFSWKSLDHIDPRECYNDPGSTGVAESSAWDYFVSGWTLYAYSQTTHFIISTSTLLKKILKAITSYLLDTVMPSTRFLHLPARSFGPSTAVTLVLTWAEVPISSGSTMPAGSTTTLRSAFSTMPPVHGNLTRGWQGVSY